MRNKTKSFSECTRRQKRSVTLTVNGRSMKVKDALKMLSHKLPGKVLPQDHYLKMSRAFMKDGKEGVDEYVANFQQEHLSKEASQNTEA